MFTNKVSINYKGFHPSKNTLESVEQLLTELQIEGPSNSRLNAHIAKDGQFSHAVYKGIIEIRSNAGSFFAKAESSQIADLIHKLLKRSRRHFSKWKERKLGGRLRIQDQTSELSFESEAKA